MSDYAAELPETLVSSISKKDRSLSAREIMGTSFVLGILVGAFIVGILWAY